jgi:hypothetical protein
MRPISIYPDDVRDCGKGAFADVALVIQLLPQVVPCLLILAYLRRLHGREERTEVN